MTLAWHFVGDRLRDGRPIPEDGVTLVHDGPLVLCQSGLHASINLEDALCYAPGNTICRVRVGGKIIHDTDKLVASERTILWRLDAEDVMRKFARQQALSVAHLWNMPDVVREYLKTGDPDLGDAASDAARTAARNAAMRTATVAGRAAVCAAARTAACAVAKAAAWAAARAAAEDAAWAAANEHLTAMVYEAVGRTPEDDIP